MATIIAARAPFYDNEFGDEFNWYVYITYQKPNPLYSELLIIKRSPKINQSVDLRLNVAPLAKDYFRHTPELTTPIDITTPTLVEPIYVYLSAEGYNVNNFASYEAYDGWVPYYSNIVAVSNMNVTKKLFRDSPQYISAKEILTENVLWLLNDGTSYSTTNQEYGGVNQVILPVINPNLTVTDAHTGLSVIGRDAGNNEIWRLEYEFVCPYDEKNTIGFVNKYGAWEFIDVDGRKKTRLMTERNEYTRYSDGSKQNYNVSGEYEYDFNTGWVDDGFEDMIEGLMLSEAVVLYTGDGSDPIGLTIDVKNINIQDSRADKMVNYNFKAKVAKPIIPIR